MPAGLLPHVPNCRKFQALIAKEVKVELLTNFWNALTSAFPKAYLHTQPQVGNKISRMSLRQQRDCHAGDTWPREQVHTLLYRNS